MHFSIGDDLMRDSERESSSRRLPRSLPRRASRACHVCGFGRGRRAALSEGPWVSGQSWRLACCRPRRSRLSSRWPMPYPSPTLDHSRKRKLLNRMGTRRGLSRICRGNAGGGTSCERLRPLDNHLAECGGAAGGTDRRQPGAGISRGRRIVPERSRIGPGGRCSANAPSCTSSSSPPSFSAAMQCTILLR